MWSEVLEEWKLLIFSKSEADYRFLILVRSKKKGTENSLK